MSLTVPLDEIFANKIGLLANHASWERVELGKISSILNGFPFKSKLFNKDKGFPVVRIRDLCKNKTETFYSGEMPKEFIVNDGDFLIGMDGMFRCVEWHGGKAGLNQRVCKIVPDEQFLAPKFLLHGLNGYLKAIENATSSVTVGHLSSRDILKIPFPLPPRSEQDRIVAKLEEVLGKLESSQKRLAKIPVALKRFRQSVLAAACSGQLTAEWRDEKGNKIQSHAEWKTMQASEACDVVQSGSTPSHGKFRFDKGVPFLKVYNIVDQKIDFESKPQFVDEAIHRGPLKRAMVKPGDVLMNIVGPPLGKVAIVPDTYSEWNINQAITLFRPKPVLNVRFLYFLLCSGLPYAQILQETRGSAGQSNISLSQCREMKFSIPPMDEQQEIVRRVESLFALADQIETRFLKAQAQVEKLTPSILAKAFRGELVPQDPTDEPAIVLLERIRMKQDKKQKTKG